MTKRRIGIDLTFLRNTRVGGIKVYAFELLTEMAKQRHNWDVVLYIPKDLELPPIALSSEFRWKRVQFKGGANTFRYIWMQTLFPIILYRDGIELIHSMAYIGPIITRARRLVTVHDLNFLAWGAQMTMPRRLSLRTICTLACKRAAAIVTVSHTMKRDIAHHLRIPSPRIIAIPNAAATGFSRAGRSGERTGNQIVAFAGTPNKNTGTVLRAFALMTEALECECRIIGPLNPADRELWATLRSDVKARVKICAFPTDEEVIALTSTSKILIFPSTYEGFGIPILEAQKVGTAVICSNCASLPEVAGNGAIQLDPFDVEGIARSAVELLTDDLKRAALTKLGSVNCERYSWASSADEMSKLYAHLLSADKAS